MTDSRSVRFPETSYGIVKRWHTIEAWTETVARRLRKSSLTVLDYGCGTGDHVTYPLACLGHHVLGVDVHEESIRQASIRYQSPTLSFRLADIDALVNEEARFDLVVCSDEIHCDLALDGRRHRPIATLSGDVARRSITLMAPSKTYNVPGLGCAFAVIQDAPLRRRFLHAMAGIVPHVNLLGLVACEAALRDGDEWRSALLEVLRRNRDFVQAAVAACPGLAMAAVESTYLAWIDARELGLKNPCQHFEAHGLGLSDGADFGAPGWVRLNFGCPLPTLEEALRRFESAVSTPR